MVSEVVLRRCVLSDGILCKISNGGTHGLYWCFLRLIAVAWPGECRLKFA